MLSRPLTNSPTDSHYRQGAATQPRGWPGRERDDAAHTATELGWTRTAGLPPAAVVETVDDGHCGGGRRVLSHDKALVVWGEQQQQRLLRGALGLGNNKHTIDSMIPGVLSASGIMKQVKD
jgi:hypothetical protein